MKKQIIGAGLVLTALLSTNALADGNITVTFDGQAIAFDTQPQLVEGSVMVPMRKIFETGDYYGFYEYRKNRRLC